MMRVAKRGTTIVPVTVRKNGPRLVRQGEPQYMAYLPDRDDVFGGGDTIEEAVDDLAASLPEGPRP